MLADVLDWIFQFRLTDGSVSLMRALLILSAGFLAARMVSRFFVRILRGRVTVQTSMLVRRGSFYLLFALVFFSALRELGFDLTVLLGAAGILSVAIGFASQTSATNIISGLFLVGERPFVLGDFIKVSDFVGEVISIDLLAVRLRTADNLMVRVPNEVLIKSPITNYTHHPIRRIDLQVGVAYKEDLEKVREIMEDVANRDPLCLEEPHPLFIFQGFGDSSLKIQFSVWAKRENCHKVETGMYLAIKKSFDEAGIEIPFPHRTLYAGSLTDPIPVRLVEPAASEHASSEGA